MLRGDVDFNTNGVSNQTEYIAKFSSANGADDATVPPFLSASSGVTLLAGVEQAEKQHGTFNVDTKNIFSKYQIDSSITAFIVTKSNSGTPANVRITPTIWAERII